MDWSLFVGGIGIGSIATAMVTAWLRKREVIEQRRFYEKRDAYYGLLSAIRDINVKRDEQTIYDVALWITRIEIIGSPDVVAATYYFRDTDPRASDKAEAYQQLVEAMRKDLSVDCRNLL